MHTHAQGKQALTHRLEALGVHLVVLLGLGPEQAGVALLVHEQVGAVHLLELQLDGRGEDLGHLVGGALGEGHGLLHGRDAELDHHRVRVAVHDLNM